MTSFFVPYVGKRPAVVSVNGHSLLILARDEDVFEEGLETMGADHLKRVEAGDNTREEEAVLKKLAEKINAGVVVASSESEFREVLKSLQQELPWVH